MSDEWGPWIEHDGMGCPVPAGTVVHAISADGTDEIIHAMCIRNGVFVGPLKENPRASAWCWAMDVNMFKSHGILRYRVRKPRGLSILREIAANPQIELERTE